MMSRPQKSNNCTLVTILCNRERAVGKELVWLITLHSQCTNRLLALLSHCLNISLWSKRKKTCFGYSGVDYFYLKNVILTALTTWAYLITYRLCASLLHKRCSSQNILTRIEMWDIFSTDGLWFRNYQQWSECANSVLYFSTKLLVQKNIVGFHWNNEQCWTSLIFFSSKPNFY